MKRTYRVHMTQLVSFYDVADVEANSEAEAEQLASEQFRCDWSECDAHDVHCAEIEDLSTTSEEQK